MRVALVGSAALHLGLGALLLMGRVGRTPDVAPPVEVELVQQSAMQQGGAAVQDAVAPAPDTHPAQQPADEGPQPPSAPAPRAPPAVNLGDGPRDSDALNVTGENVVPPAPDAAYRNRPPVYPAAAARAGAEGTVQLLIRVSEGGLPEQVVVASTSGNAYLDRAAQDAVRRWHFRPAFSSGTPVPFDYVIDIRFSLTDR